VRLLILIAMAKAIAYLKTCPENTKARRFLGGLFLSMSSLSIWVEMLCQIGLSFFSLDCVS
jgi:hypothetical protein